MAASVQYPGAAYCERQEKMHCIKHAVNNALGAAVLTAKGLDAVAQELMDKVCARSCEGLSRVCGADPGSRFHALQQEMGHVVHPCGVHGAGEGRSRHETHQAQATSAR